MSVPVLIVMLGMCGLAIDLGLHYNRKAELGGLAKTVALAAARELDGTSAGIGAALARAREAAQRVNFMVGGPAPWNDAAIQFGSSPSGTGWLDAASARSNPGGRFYVKVDTSALGAELGAVQAILMPILTGSDEPIHLSEVAVAGRSTIDVDPIAVCAMSPVPGAARANASGTDELVEYGFRRGVTYDLMQLNPGATSPASFVVDPLSPPGGMGAVDNTSPTTVSPFACAGRMWIPRITGGPIRVSSPFPIGSLYRELNARFGQYEGSACDPQGAPPDYNVKQYVHGLPSGVPWMNPRPAGASAARHAAGRRLPTIADPPAPPAGTRANMYGPLWAYARAAKFSGYEEGVPEPASGYPAFAPADWAALYPSGPTASGYPSSKAPYFATGGAHFLRPANEHLAIASAHRRVLRVPLLDCPVPAGSNVSARALAIGKFFMTSPATPTSVAGEFAGIAHETTITGQVILYP